MKKDVFDLISESDLTADLKLLSDVCGIETVKTLLRNLNGLSFYIPKISHLDTLVIKYYQLNKEKSYKIIAKELGVSEPYLKNLIAKKGN